MDVKKVRVVLTGGGSGGHIYPLLATAQSIKKLAGQNSIAVELFYVGPNDKFAEQLRKADVKINFIAAGKWRRYFSFKNIIDIPKIMFGLLQAFAKIFFIMPDVIFSKGGTGALQVVLAGVFYRIPIVIHESDVFPGLTNSISSRFAKRILVSFSAALRYFGPTKAAWVGTPVREDILVNRPTRGEAFTSLGFDGKKPLTLILGGSQGSLRISEFIAENLAEIISETQVLHQTGEKNLAFIRKLAAITLKGEDPRYRAVGYLNKEELKTALAAADLVVSRAGSGVLFEIASFGKPAIVIPLSESANDHQRGNAYEFAKGGACVVMEEENLLPKIFINQLQTLLRDKATLQAMGAASRNFFKPSSADDTAREVLSFTP